MRQQNPPILQPFSMLNPRNQGCKNNLGWPYSTQLNSTLGLTCSCDHFTQTVRQSVSQRGKHGFGLGFSQLWWVIRRTARLWNRGCGCYKRWVNYSNIVLLIIICPKHSHFIFSGHHYITRFKYNWWPTLDIWYYYFHVDCSHKYLFLPCRIHFMYKYK